MQVYVENQSDSLLDKELLANLQKLALFVLKHHQLPKLPTQTELSISFVTVGEIQALNKEFRGIDAPTDILSFNCDIADNPPEIEETNVPVAQPYLLGDIIIAPDVVMSYEYSQDFSSDSVADSASFDDRFSNAKLNSYELLIIHGIVHLCGYDHHNDHDAQKMETLERKLAQSWLAAEKFGSEKLVEGAK